MKTCTIEDCDRPAIARGWCGRHYDTWRRTGDPEGGARRAERPRYEGPSMSSTPSELAFNKLMSLAPVELERRARAVGRDDLADAIRAAWDLRNGPRQPHLVHAAAEAVVEFLLGERTTIA